MNIVKDLTQIAVEFFREPRREPIWAPKLDKYARPDSKEEGKVLLQSSQPPVLHQDRQYPILGRRFKLIVRISFILTLLFLILCVTLTLVADKEPPPLYEKVVMGLFDLVKIGAGTLLGLLGGKSLQR